MSNIMDLNKLGKFRLDRILVQYDSPFIFTCLNESNKMMLFVEDNYDSDEESWISIFIDDNRLYDLLSGVKSIQETFISVDVHNYYKIRHTFETDTYTYVKEKSFPEGILSSGKDYIRFNNEQEEKALIRGLNDIYDKTLMPAMDMHFNKYSNSHSLPVEFLINVLDNVKKIFNGIIRVKSKSLEVEPCVGSFVLRFKAVNPDKTIEKNTSTYAFRTIGNILLSDNPETVKDALIQNPRIIAPLKSLYSSLQKYNRDFEIATVSDEEHPFAYRTISCTTISSFYNELKNKKLTQSYELTKEGIMEGFNNIKSTFSLILDDGVIINGKISKDINEKNPKIRDHFSVILRVDVELDLENAKDKKTYTLLHIRHI